MVNKEINKHWKFWKPIVIKKDGSVNISQLKKELADYSFILGEVPKVYCHITDSLLSKPNYYSHEVINVADDTYRRNYIESMKYMFTELRDIKEINQESYVSLMENVDKYI